MATIATSTPRRAASLDISIARGDLLTLTHIYTSTLVLGVGALFGLFQGLSRANLVVLPAMFDYYRMLTAHGVLMALVFTTFFITGLFTYMTYRSMPRARSVTLGWIGYCTMLFGTVMATVAILSGNASVLYTFYAPLKASPLFYFGATFLVLGTWCVAADIALNITWWKRTQAHVKTPLPAFIAACTMLMWVIATLGVVAEMGLLIPWSLGWTPGIDVGLTRMLFWYFGHPLVYFWIMAAYAIWYTIVPATFKGAIFSDGLTRLAFVMLLLLSTPVGLHHQYLDPGISAGWKWLHTVTTYGVVIPSFMTAFAIFATFEVAARKAGVRGFWNTVRWLPWRNPVFAGPALGMLLFIPGGFGGIVNNSYSMDVLVHNTMWIVGHFHITVGGPVALTFIGAAYGLVPALSGRALFAPRLALVQVYTYFVGMTVMSTAMHWAGLLGSPRRTSDVSYFGAQGAATWHPQMLWAAIGGSLVAVSILMFIIVATGTFLADRQTGAAPEFRFANADEAAMATPPVLDKLGRWGVIALALAVLAYAGPVWQQISAHAYLAPGHADVVIALVLAFALQAFVPSLHAGDAVPPLPLADQNGRAFTLAGLRGNVVVVSFLYTSCGDAHECPLVAAKFGRMQRAIGAAPIRLVTLTLDPLHDTPERLRAYGATYGADAARWKLAGGDAASVEELVARFGVTTLVRRAANGFVHDESVVIVDREGRIARTIAGNAWLPEDVLAQARGYAGAPVDPLTDARLWLGSAVERCGGSGGSLTAAAVLGVLAAALVLIGTAVARAFAASA